MKKTQFNYSEMETVKLIQFANNPFLSEDIQVEIAVELQRRIPDNDLFLRVCQAVCQ